MYWYIAMIYLLLFKMFNIILVSICMTLFTVKLTHTCHEAFVNKKFVFLLYSPKNREQIKKEGGKPDLMRLMGHQVKNKEPVSSQMKREKEYSEWLRKSLRYMVYMSSAVSRPAL